MSFAEVESVLREAYELAPTDDSRAVIAAKLSSAISLFPDRSEEADRLLADVAAQLTDAGARLNLEAQRASQVLRAGDVGHAIPQLRKVLETDGLDVRDEAFAQASRDLGTALALAGQTTEALVHVDTSLAALRDITDTDISTTEAVYIVAKSLALGEAGRLEESFATAEAGYAVSVSRRNAHGQGWFGMVLGLIALNRGMLATADHLFRETASVFADRSHPSVRWCIGGLALAAGQRADKKAAAAAVKELDSLGPNAMRMMDIHVARGRAWAALAESDLNTAQAILWRAVDLAAEWGQTASQSAALHDLLRMGAGATAARRLEELEGLVDGTMMAGRLAYARAFVSSDPALAGESADIFEATGALLFAAEAAALEERVASERGLRRRASTAAARSTRLVVLCEGPHTPALGSAGPQADLSLREREVALLAASGLTSREIAERLFVSVRTVDNHLQRVYVKLGIGGRSDLVKTLGNGHHD